MLIVYAGVRGGFGSGVSVDAFSLCFLTWARDAASAACVRSKR
jgi:hypothetical protein